MKNQTPSDENIGTQRDAAEVGRQRASDALNEILMDD